MLNNKDILSHIFIKQGDITKESTDAIVNAANPSLLGGGGVDGAIHKAAGPELLMECRALGGCDFGEARITKGYNLKAKYVIHTPGPIFKGGKNKESEILKNSYFNSLQLAKDNGIHSIALPAISTGVYNYPKEKACEIAINSVFEFMKKNNYIIDVIFILFDNDNAEIYSNYINTIKSKT